MIPPRQAGRDEDREEGHATRRNEDPPARSQHRELGGQSTEDVGVDDGLMARHCEGKAPPAARRWPWSTSRWPPASWRRPGEPGPEAIRPAACGRSPRRWTECGMRFSPCLVGPAPGLWRLAPASPLQLHRRVAVPIAAGFDPGAGRRERMFARSHRRRSVSAEVRSRSNDEPAFPGVVSTTRSTHRGVCSRRASTGPIGGARGDHGPDRR